MSIDDKLRTLALVDAYMKLSVDDVSALLTVTDTEDLVRLVLDLLAFSATAATMLAEARGTTWERLVVGLREAAMRGDFE